MEMTRRTFLGLIGAVSLTSCAHRIPIIGGGGEQEPWAVAGLSDLHVKEAPTAAIVNRAVAQINATPGIRFSVVIGDLSTNGQLAELNMARESLDRLAQPCLAVPGNHDVDVRAGDPYANFKRNFGSPSWIHEENQWVFFGLDTCEGAASDVAVRPDRLDWLEKRLRKTGKNRPIGVFAHHPFGPSTAAYRVKNADEVIGLFSGHNLKFIASAHYHGNQEEVANGVLFTTTACCSSTRDNFDKTAEKGYRLFRITGDEVATEFVPVAVRAPASTPG
jgi:hypothetical protein